MESHSQRLPLAFALGSALALIPILGGCRAARLPAPPTAPQAEIRDPAPPAPRPPQPLPAATPPAAPTLPEGRLQSIEEVYENLFWRDAIPESFPFDRDTRVAVLLPEGSPDHVRAALLGAFLAAGYKVKDAGRLQQTQFLIDHHPDRGGPFWRGAEAGAPPFAPEEDRAHVALWGMKLGLADPTSLWVPDLLANPNLRSDHFVRTFHLGFHRTEVTVERRTLFGPDQVSAYRQALERSNALVRSYNSDSDFLRQSVARYGSEYEDYLGRFEAWRLEQERLYEEAYGAYLRAFAEWRNANWRTLRRMERRGRLPGSIPRQPSAKARQLVTTQPQPMARIPLRDPLDTLTARELDRALAQVQETSVPSLQLDWLFGVVDATSGEVVQVVHAVSRARTSWTEAALLRETVARLSP